jgi:hypothetical protein
LQALKCFPNELALSDFFLLDSLLKYHSLAVTTSGLVMFVPFAIVIYEHERVVFAQNREFSAPEASLRAREFADPDDFDDCVCAVCDLTQVFSERRVADFERLRLFQLLCYCLHDCLDNRAV